MIQYVVPGQTFTLKGTFAQQDTLVADAGTAHKHGALVVVRGRAKNLGMIGLTGGNSATTAGATLSDTGTLKNGGVITVGGGYYSGAGALLQVSGTLTNDATIAVQEGFQGAGGQLEISTGGSLNNAGELVLDASTSANAGGGTVVDAGVLMNSQAIFIGGGNAGDPGTGALFAVTGSLVNQAQLTVEGARFASGADLGSGVLNVSGVLQNSGELLLSSDVYGANGGMLLDGGDITNGGTIAADGGGYSADYTDLGSVIEVAGVLTNSGLITLYPGFSGADSDIAGDGARLIDSGVLTNTGNIIVEGGGDSDAAATISVTGTLADSGTISGGGMLDNTGVISSGTHGLTSGAIAVATLINDGSVEVAPSGSFAVASAVSADAGDVGVFDITQQSTLTLGGAISTSQMVSFLGNHATLALGNAVGFAGTIDGLGPRDTIDFLGLAVTSVNPSGAVLDIGLADGNTLDLTLDAPLTGVSIGLTGDGNGGTDMVLARSSDSVSYGPERTGGVMGMDRALGGKTASDMNSPAGLHLWIAPIC